MMTFRGAGMFAFLFSLTWTLLLLVGASCLFLLAFWRHPRLVWTFLSFAWLCSPRTRRCGRRRAFRLGSGCLACLLLQADVLLALVGLFLEDACPDSEAVHRPTSKRHRQLVQNEPKAIPRPAEAAQHFVLPAKVGYSHGRASAESQTLSAKMIPNPVVLNSGGITSYILSMSIYRGGGKGHFIDRKLQGQRSRGYRVAEEECFCMECHWLTLVSKQHCESLTCKRRKEEQGKEKLGC